MHAEARFALALSALPGVGRRRLRTLLQRRVGHAPTSATDVADFVRAAGSELKLRPIEGAAVDRAWDAASRLVDTCLRRDWRLWIIDAADYPRGLMRLDDPPALLFVHGGHRAVNAPRLAIVGTREPTAWGLEQARIAAEAAVAVGATVVSGLAWGIDTAAHEATVAAGGVTWATLPSGLDLVYPPSNHVLAERLVAAGGALISEYPPGTRPHATFFVERDRLQAALSAAVVVIESGLTGGTLHTVRFARALKVPVWATLPEAPPNGHAGGVGWPEAQQGTARLVAEGVPRIDAAEVGRLVAGGPAGNHDAPGDSQQTLF